MVFWQCPGTASIRCVRGCCVRLFEGGTLSARPPRPRLSGPPPLYRATWPRRDLGSVSPGST
eukprot:8920771-Alexandrium_andersonii.AAC.1